MRIYRLYGIFLTALAVVLVWHGPLFARDWDGLEVKSYYGTYDPEGKKPGGVAPSLSRPMLEEWHPPTAVKKQLTIGVSLPHLKDSYWVLVQYGLVEEARKLGIQLVFRIAGGFERLNQQIKDIRELADLGVDGIILGSVSYVGNDGVIREMAERGIPVVELAADVFAPEVAAKVLVSYYEAGYSAGEFVAEDLENRHSAGARIAFFPGPMASGWAPESVQGFKGALAYDSRYAEIVYMGWGDTRQETQEGLLREALTKLHDIDYIVANAVAAVGAVKALRELGLTRPKIVSTYLTEEVYKGIVDGDIAAAPCDMSLFQGRMAVDMMCRIFNGDVPGKDMAFRTGPYIPLVTSANIHRFPSEELFGPAGYIPIEPQGEER